mmetsp:Transcript_23992/g.42969  ORF Transcript_23992/g.42969 Transcript_23992/m.42969 type:complete len:233 (+) Transcript_23992:1451-2149(+)
MPIRIPSTTLHSAMTTSMITSVRKSQTTSWDQHSTIPTRSTTQAKRIPSIERETTAATLPTNASSSTPTCSTKPQHASALPTILKSKRHTVPSTGHSIPRATTAAMTEASSSSSTSRSPMVRDRWITVSQRCVAIPRSSCTERMVIAISSSSMLVIMRAWWSTQRNEFYTLPTPERAPWWRFILIRDGIHGRHVRNIPFFRIGCPALSIPSMSVLNRRISLLVDWIIHRGWC